MSDVRAEPDDHVVDAPMSSLRVRPIRTSWVVDGGLLREPDHHPLEEVLVGVRTWHEVPRQPPDDSEPRRTAERTLLERATPRDPELVCVRVDHPVGPVLGRREPSHLGSPCALPDGSVPTHEPKMAIPLVRLERLRRSVLRLVVDAITKSTPASRW